MDDEIIKTVKSMLGSNIKIVDREETSSIREEETLLINGIPVTLEGDDGEAIKTALMTGQVPPCELLNQILYRAGILRQPVHLETSLSVKSTTVKKEEVTVARNGMILDDRINETKEDNYYTSQCSEIWEPIKSLRTVKENIPVRVDSENVMNKKSVTEVADSLKGSTVRSKDSTVWKSSNKSSGMDASFTNSPSLTPSVFPTSSSSSVSSTFETETPSLTNKNQFYNSFNNGEASSYFSLGTDASIKHSSRNENFPNNSRTAINYNLQNSISLKDVENQQSFAYNKKSLAHDPNLSYDSGHDDIFNSLSQNNVLQRDSTGNSIFSSCDMISSSDETDFIKLSESLPVKCDLPTIFGTVASDQSPKDNTNKRALPQTTSNNSASRKINEKKTPSKGLLQCSDNEKRKVATEDNSLVYRDDNLISGPLDALIQHMVPTSDYYPDRSYIFAFLLSARLFIRPYKLLERICELCEEQQNFTCKLTNESQSGLNDSRKIHDNADTKCSEGGDYQQDHQQQKKEHRDDEECCKKLKLFAQHFVQLLAEWVDTFPYDFRDERLMQHVRVMSKKCICIDNNLHKDVSTMLQNLLHRLTVLEKYEEFLQSISNYSSDCSNSISMTGGTSENRILSGISTNQNCSTHSSTYQATTGGLANASVTQQTNSSTSGSLHGSNNAILSSVDISELCPNPTFLAHQLTHIELERLSHIGPEEFVQAFAKENPHLEQSFNDIKKTRNLESYIQWFNRLSYLVATEIVKHCKKKQRARVIEYWIETARECFNIGNFNSLMAIIAGLNMSPISRLKKTWAHVQSAKFSVLEHQMDPSSNFNSYRLTLKAAMWRSAGATNERERIVIPFFSLLVKDLYFLNEGCSNKLENGHVNFEKFWQLAKQVTEFMAWKQVTCPFEKIPKVIMFLYTNHILNENMLALASFEREPPANHEKDRYKCLKSEQQQQQQQQQ